MEFGRFGKIPRLDRQIKDGYFDAGTYAITGKLDGANAGIVRVDGGLLLHSRNRAVAFIHETDEGQNVVEDPFRGFVAWAVRFRNVLLDDMNMGDHAYGEWLVPHTIQYPDGMLKEFYTFDYGIAGVESVPQLAIHELDSFNAMEVAQTHLDRYIEVADYPVEGVVLRNVETDERFKLVRDEFKEEASRKWSGNDDGPDAIELRLASVYPGRSYTKVAQKVADDHDGQINITNTGEVVGRAWQDYLDEFFVPAIRDQKPAQIQMRVLQREVQGRVREMFHSEINTGELPQWAL